MIGRSLVLALALCLSATSAMAREAMAKYGESYEGPKTLTVEVAPLASGEKVLIKIFGVNHAWDKKVFSATVRKGGNDSTQYVIDNKGEEYVLMIDGRQQGPNLYLPGLGELPLNFNRDAALDVQPEHIMTEFEEQDAPLP